MKVKGIWKTRQIFVNGKELSPEPKPKDLEP
jgi:hypothetical protein